MAYNSSSVCCLTPYYIKIVFFSFILSPEALQKPSKILIISFHSPIDALDMIRMSSTNKRWIILKSLETLVPLSNPSSLLLFKAKLKPYIIIIKNKGDNGQPRHNPLSLLKKSVGSPLTKVA